jgi:hypothetical protein
MDNFKFRALSLVAGTLLASSTLPSCATEPAVVAPQASAIRQQQLGPLPPEFREALTQEPEDQQEEFFAQSDNERAAIIAQWQEAVQRREQLMDSFTPAERTIISTLSQEDKDAFFALPDDDKNRHERFLAGAETRYLDMLDDCHVRTHRRFGPATETPIDPQSLNQCTVPEQAVITRLTPKEVQGFTGMPTDMREQFVTETVNRKVEQLLSCETRSNRRLEESLEESL